MYFVRDFFLDFFSQNRTFQTILNISICIQKNDVKIKRIFFPCPLKTAFAVRDQGGGDKKCPDMSLNFFFINAFPGALPILFELKSFFRPDNHRGGTQALYHQEIDLYSINLLIFYVVYNCVTLSRCFMLLAFFREFILIGGKLKIYI